MEIALTVLVIFVVLLVVLFRLFFKERQNIFLDVIEIEEALINFNIQFKSIFELPKYYGDRDMLNVMEAAKRLQEIFEQFVKKYNASLGENISPTEHNE